MSDSKEKKEMPEHQRPIFLTQDQLVQIERLAGLGMSQKDMAYVLGLSRSMIQRRLIDQPEVAEAVEKGKARASAAVRSTAFKMATSGKCAVMTMFWLKCRENWRESSEIVDTDTNVVKLTYEPRSKRA